MAKGTLFVEKIHPYLMGIKGLGKNSKWCNYSFLQRCQWVPNVDKSPQGAFCCASLNEAGTTLKIQRHLSSCVRISQGPLSETLESTAAERDAILMCQDLVVFFLCKPQDKPVGNHLDLSITQISPFSHEATSMRNWKD